MVLALDGTEEVVGKPIVEVVVEPTGSTTLFLLITADIIFCQMICKTGHPTGSSTCTLYKHVHPWQCHSGGQGTYKRTHIQTTLHRCPTYLPHE